MSAETTRPDPKLLAALDKLARQAGIVSESTDDATLAAVIDHHHVPIAAALAPFPEAAAAVIRLAETAERDGRAR